MRAARQWARARWRQVAATGLSAAGFAQIAQMLTLLFAIAAAPAPVAAGEVDEFFARAGLTIVVGYAPGGGYDQAARALARHIGRHVPGKPHVLVRNMPGAGTVVAANHVTNAAPRDGSVIGIYADIMVLARLLEMPGVQFDPRRLGWLGSLASRGTPVFVLRADAPATTIEGLRHREVLVGASGADATAAYSNLLADVLGLRLKVLSGYRGGTAELDLALERGEIHGRTSKDWETLKRQDWLERKLVTVVLQMAVRPHPDLPQVPVALALARSEADRQVMEMVLGTNQFFRAFSTAPGVPGDRLEALRAAFAATVADPEFVADFSKGSPGGPTYAGPRQIEEFMARVHSFPPDVIGRAARFVAP